MTDMMVDLRRADRELEPSDVKASHPREIQGISFTRDLANRRVPLITGVYLGASFGLLLLVRWLADRYPISPNVPDFSLALFASMIPTVVMLAYFHGGPGRTPWTRVERIGIPANVLAAVALLFVLFQGRDLGAVTTVVQATNEEGQTVERVVPKSEFRKRVGLFYFDNETGNPDFDWAQYGVTQLLLYDLGQDIYVDTYYGFNYQHRNAGFKSPIGSPLTLKRKLARDTRRNYFVTGSFSTNGDQYVIRTHLYETKSGKRLNERVVTGSSIFAMADSLSLQLRRDMGVPSYHIEESADLPVAEVLTASEAAFKLFAVAEPLALDNDFRQAGSNLIEAIEIDPTFAAAHEVLFQVYSGLGREEQAKDALRKAIQHRYKLPEEDQYELRSLYQLSVNEDVDAGIEVAKEWVTLYPQSIKAHRELANYYEMRNEIANAVDHREAILELDPDQAGELHTISNLYAAQGNQEKALVYSQRYADRFTDRFDAYTHLAGIYTNMGDLEKVKASYEKALTIEPDDVLTIRNLALTEGKLGNDANADRLMERALVASKSPQDSMRVYNFMADHCRIAGEVSKAVDYKERYMDVYARQYPPMQVIYTRADEAALYYADAGRAETAFEILSTAVESMQGDTEKAMMGELYFNTYHAIDDARYLDDLRAQTQRVESTIDKFRMESERWRVFRAKGLIAHWEGNHAEAAAHYERAIELIAKTSLTEIRNFRLYAGRCRHESGNLPAALDHFEKALAYNPQHPKPHYGIALVYHDMGEHEKAMTHLTKALDLWKNADPVYKPAQAAWATLAEWQAAGPQ
jgi:tetratricopeptide (TPR) repeat protein